MLAPVHTKNTARIGSAPVNSAPVNEPKNFGVVGKKGRDERAEQQRHDHQAARHAFDGAS